MKTIQRENKKTTKLYCGIFIETLILQFLEHKNNLKIHAEPYQVSPWSNWAFFKRISYFLVELIK